MSTNPQSTNNNKPKIRLRTILISLSIFIVIIALAVTGIYLWQKYDNTEQVKNALITIATDMDKSHQKGNGYPNTTLANNDEVTFSGGSSSDGTTYCIVGISKKDESVVYHIDSTKLSEGPLVGLCGADTATSAPSKPGGLAFTTATSSELNVRWDSAPHATSYVLQCSTDEKFSNPTTVKATNTTGKFEKLKSSTRYFCRVKATNSIGDSAWSSLITMDTFAK